MTDAERILQLEERVAWLQRHLVEQDRVMMEFGEDIARLRREMAGVRERMTSDGNLSEGSSFPADEKPPHY